MLVLHLLDILSITLAALVLGVFWGPWLGLTRSIATLTPEVFLVVVHRLDKNLGGIMGALFPLSLLSILPVLFFTFGQPISFALTLGGLVLFVLALVITAAVEVPIVMQIRGWSAQTMPADWSLKRDRWVAFHVLRVVPGIAGLIFLVAGALWQK